MCLLSASVPLVTVAVVVIIVVADFISKIEIVLQMSRPNQSSPPYSRWMGAKKINGAKMIQLRKPKERKKYKSKVETGGSSSDKFLKLKGVAWE